MATKKTTTRKPTAKSTTAKAVKKAVKKAEEVVNEFETGDVILADEVEEVDGLYHEFNTLMRVKEYKEAEFVLESLCAKGNMKAIVKYGLMLIRGECVEKNVNTGFKLLSKGKEHRDGEGLYELGRCYARNEFIGEELKLYFGSLFDIDC